MLSGDNVILNGRDQKQLIALPIPTRRLTRTTQRRWF
jgi:hypothetical protein